MSCYCCEDSITVDGKTCEYTGCYYQVNILWLYTITVCEYDCGDGHRTTRKWRRFLWWCKSLD